MVKIGNQRKQDQCEETKQLTADMEQLQLIIQRIEASIAFKQTKLNQIENQRKNLELEISGLDLGVQAVKAKLSKRESQIVQSEAMVKKQKDELRNIQKVITPELVKKLYDLLENKNAKKIVEMVEALVGLLRNSENVTSYDVQIYLKKHEGLMYKMQNVVTLKMKDSVLDKHLETIKTITKSFIDSSSDDYGECSPYAPFLAWASQFIIYCRQAQQLEKVESQVKSLNKELDERNEKYQCVKVLVDTLAKEGYGPFFEKEIEEDTKKVEKYKGLLANLEKKAREEQLVYQNFERRFFQELEEFVIKKKLTAGIASSLIKK